MRQINGHLPTKHTISKTQAGNQEANTADKEIINMVYARLKTICGGKYPLVFRSEMDEKLSKREWQRDIIKYSLEELERGLRQLKAEGGGYPDVGYLLTLCKPAKQDPAHKDFQLPPPRNIDRKAGHKNASNILDMLKK